MVDTLIALVSQPLNILLFLLAFRRRARCATIGQMLILLQTPCMLWLYTHDHSAYNVAYGYSEFFQTLCVMVMAFSLGSRPRQQIIAALILCQLMMKAQTELSDLPFGYEATPAMHYFWEAIDFAWTTLWCFDLYSVDAATPQRRKKCQERGYLLKSGWMMTGQRWMMALCF